MGEIDFQRYYNDAVDAVVSFLPKLALVIVLFIVGRYVIQRLQRYINIMIEKSDIDNELSGFLQSIVGVILNGVLIFMIVPIIGIELSALIGILAAMGFAVGMALQGFLGNFAAGLTIIFFKPYRVGDWVQVSDHFGKVQAIQIFNTILKTPGDKTLVIPNGQITENIITNFSTEGRIRLELTVPIGYQQSFPQIKQIIQNALSSIDIIMQNPAPYIGIESYDSHTVMVTVRPYIDPDYYWEATFEVNEAIKKAFSENNIQMTYSEGIENGPIGA